jgi:hypothetical protein
MSDRASIVISMPPTARDNEDTDHEGGDTYSTVETSLDPEPRFDINASGGHMSLPNPRLKARSIGTEVSRRRLVIVERSIAYYGF